MTTEVSPVIVVCDLLALRLDGGGRTQASMVVWYATGDLNRD